MTVYNLRKKVKIPFLWRFRDPIWMGVKTRTSRTSQMGEPGDIFDAFGTRCQINRVWKTSLSIVRLLWKSEGVGSPEEFEEVWRQIHPRKGFDPGQLVYVHDFSRVDPEHPFPFRPCETCKKPFIPTLGEGQSDCVVCIELKTPHDEGDEEPN